MGSIVQLPTAEPVPPLYRCPECAGLSQNAPVQVQVSEWDSAMEGFITAKRLICYVCLDVALILTDPPYLLDSDDPEPY